MSYNIKVNSTTEAQRFHSSNTHKWLPYKIKGGKTLRNIQINESTNKGDMAETANRYNVHEGVSL